MSLDSLKEEIIKKDDDIEILLSIITKLDNKQLESILKSSIVILLYNKTEFFYREIILSIYDEIKDCKVSFFNLNEKIQKTIAKQLFPANISRIEKLTLLKNLFENNIISEYLLNRKDIANGNVTGEEFRNFFSSYNFPNIPLLFDNEFTLKTLLDKRNELAHGDKNFSDVGKEITIEQLSSFNEKLKGIFLDILDKLEIFLNEQHYLS